MERVELTITFGNSPGMGSSSVDLRSGSRIGRYGTKSLGSFTTASIKKHCKPVKNQIYVMKDKRETYLCRYFLKSELRIAWWLQLDLSNHDEQQV